MVQAQCSDVIRRGNPKSYTDCYKSEPVIRDRSAKCFGIKGRNPERTEPNQTGIRSGKSIDDIHQHSAQSRLRRMCFTGNPCKSKIQRAIERSASLLMMNETFKAISQEKCLSSLTSKEIKGSVFTKLLAAKVKSIQVEIMG